MKQIIILFLVVFSLHCYGQEKRIDVNGTKFNVLLKGAFLPEDALMKLVIYILLPAL